MKAGGKGFQIDWRSGFGEEHAAVEAAALTPREGDHPPTRHAAKINNGVNAVAAIRILIRGMTATR